MNRGGLSTPLFKAVTVLEKTRKGHEKREEFEDAKLCERAIRLIKRLTAEPGKRRKK